jgi:CHASE3 domain sensor protein
MTLRGAMIEKTRMVKYRKYRQQIKKIRVNPEESAESFITPREVIKPQVEEKTVISPTSTTTSMTVDQIIEVHNKMLLQETEDERLRKKENAKINERWRKIGIIVVVIIAVCLIIGLAAFLYKELQMGG